MYEQSPSGDAGATGPDSYWENTQWANGSGGTKPDISIDGGTLSTNVLSLMWPASSWPLPIPVTEYWRPADSEWVADGESGVLDLNQQFGDVTNALFAGTYPFNLKRSQEMAMFTGGKKGSGGQSLVEITLSVYRLSLPPLTGLTIMGKPSDYLVPTPLPPQLATVGDFGHPGADGKLWVVVPDGETESLITRVPVDLGEVDFVDPPVGHHLSIQASFGTNNATLESNVFASNANFIVGQKISFSPIWDVEPTGVQTNYYQWSFTGHYYNDRTNTVPGMTFPDCSRSYYTNENLLTAQTVTNWWVSGGFSPFAEYTATLSNRIIYTNGNIVTNIAIGKFHMARPLAQVSPVTTSTVVWTNQTIDGAPVYLQFVQPTPTMTNFGITFYYSLVLPSGFSGSNFWVQTITSTARSATESNGTTHSTSYPAFPCLDSTPGQAPIPYNALLGTNAVDSPGQSLSIFPTNYITVSASGNYKMYLEFGPPGGVGVPLRVVNWFWSASATNSGSGWSVSAATNSPNPADADTEEYPQWINNITNNLGWSPHL